MATKKKPIRKATKTAKPTKAAEPAKAAIPAKAAKAAKKKSGTKGKRYSPAEKQKVLALVEQVNAKKGRGGVTAAVKKFGVTALTISNWIKKEGGGAMKVAKAAAPRKRADKRPGKSAGTWERMVALKADIDVMERKLEAKKAEFSQLAKKL